MGRPVAAKVGYGMTNERPSAEAIDARATEWVTRRDRGALDAQTSEEFAAWLASDSRCRGAYARAQAAWLLLDRAQALATPGGELPRAEPSSAERAPNSVARWGASRRRVLFGGIAAAAVIACVAVYGLLLQPRTEQYATQLGEIRSVPLQDGSLVAINTDSHLSVDMEQALRSIQLDRGEAWFHVAKDASRPFIVAAGVVRVRAVGTAFSVRRRAEGVEVLVTEGVVSTWIEGQENTRRSLSAGTHAFIDARGEQRVEQDSEVIERALAWRSRKIDLQGVTLAQAAAEFNRYNTRKLIIDDPVLAAEPLVGRFEIDAVQPFARAAAKMLNARIESDAKQIRLVPAEHPRQ